jgi:hypothetical protein
MESEILEPAETEVLKPAESQAVEPAASATEESPPPLVLESTAPAIMDSPEPELPEAAESEIVESAQSEPLPAGEVGGAEPEVVAPEIVRPKPRPPLLSSHDFSNRKSISGWAFDPANPDEFITVEIMANGVVIGRAVADMHRPDLESAGIGDGCHSFDFRPEAGRLAYDVRYTIWVRNQATGIPLRNSPKILPVEPAPPPDEPTEPVTSPDVELAAEAESSVAVEAVAEPVETAHEPIAEGAPVAAPDEMDSRPRELPEPEATVSIADASPVDEPDGDRQGLVATQAAPAGTVVETVIDEPPASVEPAAVSAVTSPIASPIPTPPAVPRSDLAMRRLRSSRIPGETPAVAPVKPLSRLAAFIRRASRRRTRKEGSSLPPPSEPPPASAPAFETSLTPAAAVAVLISVDPLPNPLAVGLGRLQGSLDIAARHGVSGWAVNEADPSLPVGLLVTANGNVLTRVLANRFRADLEKAGIGNGSHGFELMFPELSPLMPHELHVVREADGVEVPGSPKIIPAARNFDLDAQAGIASILSGLDEESEARALEFLVRQADRLLSRKVDRDTDRAARHLRYLFRRRWGRATGSEVGWVPKDEALGPRLLIIDDYIPDPGRDAGSVAILSHIQAVKGVGFEIDFVAARDMDDRVAAQSLEAGAGITVCGLPYYYSVEDVLKRQAGLFDAVYLHRISNARKYMTLVRAYQPKARVIYSVADLHHLRLARQGEVERLDSLARASEQLAVDEFMCARQADVVITHSHFEAGLLGRRVPPAKIHVVPWSVAPRPRTVPFVDRRGLAMIGHFAHKPNPDSVFWLLRNVMPLVWEADPSMRCSIVGHGWNEEHFPRRDDRVDIVGYAPDLLDVFNAVRLTVAPLRFGAGIKGKVLDSLAAGIPCVMSPVAAEGIPLTPLLTELVASTPRTTADAILRFHSDEAANLSAADAGLDMVAREYSGRRVLQAMSGALPLSRTNPIAIAV